MRYIKSNPNTKIRLFYFNAATIYAQYSHQKRRINGTVS